jgi:hypothetical protein
MSSRLQRHHQNCNVNFYSLYKSGPEGDALRGSRNLFIVCSNDCVRKEHKGCSGISASDIM